MTTDEVTTSPSFNNCPCPIHRLPAKILETVFIHCARDHYTYNPGGLTTTTPSWVNISYVCRLWRNIALNCPTFWTFLSLLPWRWTEEILARSKQASLKILVSPRADQLSQALRFVEQVMNHVERIQKLDLYVSPADIDIFRRCLATLLSHSASGLQTPRITSFITSDLSSAPFGGDTPVLRVLFLRNCSIEWHTFELSSLTTLSLCCDSGLDYLSQDMEKFLNALSAMQGLTHLHLKGALPITTRFVFGTPIYDFQRFSLPHLSHVLVIAPLFTVTVLLSCINIPLEAEVKLNIHSEHASSLDDYTPLTSLLAQRFNVSEGQALPGPKIRTLAVAPIPRLRSTTFCFSALERDCGSSTFERSQDWGKGIPLRIGIFFHGLLPTSVMDLITAHFCCHIPSTNLQSLHIHHPPFSQAFWVRLLGHFQNLRYIKFSEGHMPDLARSLSAVYHDSAKNEGEQSVQVGGLAPALEELEFFKTRFVTWLATEPERATNRLPEVVQSLCDALSTRKGPRGQITMTRCKEYYAKSTRLKVLNMAGWWEGGRFHLVDKHSEG